MKVDARLLASLNIYHGHVTYQAVADNLGLDYRPTAETLFGVVAVDGAIHQAAGSGLVEACRNIGCRPTGDERLMGGHGLPARHAIHTVVPVWRGAGVGEAA